MKTKNIFKALVLASVLLSACGKNEIADDFKGYPLPVTVNVSRQGDEPATRATYNESTKKLEFSAGDKLFVYGSQNNAGKFAGTLDYDAVSGKFSGTVTTQYEYTGTIDNLMETVNAFLLPAGYESYGFYSVSGSGYEATVTEVDTKAFALTKAAAVEQFSYEVAYSYSSGFALAPMNAIVSFTISGLTANKEVAVSFDTDGAGVISGKVTTNATGVATFAVGVYLDCKLENCTLTVDGNNIAMPTKTTEAGHIYNISRSAAAAAEGHALSASAVGEIVGTDGKAYAVGDKDNLPTGVTAVAMVAYKSGSNGLAIQLNDSPEKMNWAQAKTNAEGLTVVPGGTWRLPSKDDWQNMFVGCAVSGDATVPDANDQMNPIAGFKAKIAATGITWKSSTYWSSTEGGPGAWLVGVNLGDSSASATFIGGPAILQMYVLGCLAF